MRFKIFDLMGKGIGHKHAVNISNDLLEHFDLDQFVETQDAEEADLILMFAVVHGIDPNVDYNFMKGNGVYASFGPHDLLNNKDVFVLSKALEEKSRLFWFDALGPNVHTDSDVMKRFPDVFRGKDIGFGPSSLPSHDNIFPHVFHISSRSFYDVARCDRFSKSAIMMYNEFFQTDKHIEIVRGFIESLDHLFVTSTAVSDDVLKGFGKHGSKILSGGLSYPSDVRNHLSRYEFVVTLSPNWGIEMMGIEGAFCGCQPIYPRTPYYENIFEGMNVKFFDLDDPVGSISDIFEAGSDFTEKDVNAFVAKYSAQNNLPKFWNGVYEILSESKDK